ncbi:MAG TPA: peptidase domain-containing ABC transporter, partial [Candidatus Hydrogenedentes bacterium]|nr:peptidase domain-containing ABC transporter [Candidatus Hydrogenedentota bacterium]
VHLDGESETLDEVPDKKHPFATREGLFRKRRKRLRRMPFVRQIDEMDCGAASLAMVCRHFGRRVSLARIRQLAHTAYDGTSLHSIVSAATELGLAARGVKVAPEDLDHMPLPAIIHWEGNHWMVLVDVRRRHVRIADPASGIRWLPRKQCLADWSGYAALFDYTAAFKSAEEGASTWGWALEFIRPFRLTLLQILLLAVVTSSLQLLLPIFTQVIVDKVVVENDVGTLHIMVIAMLLALVFMLIANILQRFMLSFAAIHIDAAILDFLTRKLLALPMSYFNTRRTGDIQRRLAGARQVREFIVQSGVEGLLAVVQITAYLSVMAVYSVTLLLVFLVTAPCYIGLMYFSTKVLRPLFDRLEESYAKYSSHQIDAIKGIEAVKAAAAEQGFRDTILNEFLSVSRTQFRSNFVVMFYESTIQVVGFLSTVLFLWVGAHMVMRGQLTLGGFVAFNAIVAMAYSPILTALSLWDDLQRSSVLMNRLNDIFEYEPEQGRDRSHLLPVPTLEGRVEFQNVSFHYGGPGSPEILRNINLETPPGSVVAIVGRSGSGKT